MNQCHLDPTTVNDAAAKATPGGIYWWINGSGLYQRFVYAQAKHAVTYAAGQPCSFAAVNHTAVTNDVSQATSVLFGGLAMLVMTENYYGYFLIWGYYATIKTSGADDIAVGESLIVHATTDGTCDGVAAGSRTTASFGVAVVADIDADNTVAGFITGPNS